MQHPTQQQVTKYLLATGWELVYQERFQGPRSNHEIYSKKGYEYLLNLGWPVNGDCNGATTTEIEVHKAINRIADAEGITEEEARQKVLGIPDPETTKQYLNIQRDKSLDTEVPEITREHFSAINNSGALPMVVVYESPEDYPGEFIARVWQAMNGQAQPTRIFVRAPSFDQVKAKFPCGMYFFPRCREDDLCIVGAYI